MQWILNENMRNRVYEKIQYELDYFQLILYLNCY